MSDTVLTPDAPARPRSAPTGSSFVGLVGVELRRLWWRRLTKVAVVAVIAFVGVAVYSVYQQTNPESIAQQISDYRQMAAETQKQNDAIPAEEKAKQIADCKTQQEQQRATEPGADFACDKMFASPDPNDFGIVTETREQLTRGLLQAGVYLVGFLAFLLGASFVAAEFSSGSMGSWLTFQPRRVRVALSKLAAATVGGVGLGLLTVALTALGVAGVTTLNRPDAALNLPDAPGTTTDTFTEAIIRVVAAVALGGLGGAAMGLILRSTAGVVGLVLGYAILVEGFMANAFQNGALKPWFVSPNLDAFVQNGTFYYAETCTSTGCQFGRLPISYTHGWVYLLVIAVVGVVAALLVFRRRDVN